MIAINHNLNEDHTFLGQKIWGSVLLVLSVLKLDKCKQELIYNYGQYGLVVLTLSQLLIADTP